MNYRRNIFLIIFICLKLGNLVAQTNPSKSKKPNIIIIFTDDQGYQDLGCYHSPLIKTPHLDQMAKEGIRFTDFYVSSPVCSPSRASLLTGRNPSRHGIGNALFPQGTLPRAKVGLAQEEITIAEILKTVNYKTACFGKWHLGDQKGLLPTDQGFDEYFGIPYSNDMYIGPYHEFSDRIIFRDNYTLEQARADQAAVKKFKNFKDIKQSTRKGKCPLFEGDQIVEYPCEQSTLTRRYFDRAIEFIKKADNSPFFIYLTPAMPHVPLYASKNFEGSSKRGLYGDVIEEIDWHVGRLLQYLKENRLDENTMIIFSSDNGPWLKHKENGGSAMPLRDGKTSVFEGGIRVPCIMRWTNTWEAGLESHQIASTYDLLPTIAHYTGVQMPKAPLDGQNLASHLENSKIRLKNSVYLIFRGTKIAGIRKGKWKYLPQGGKRNILDAQGNPFPPMLFNLELDISEQNNLYEKYPDIVQELDSVMQEMCYK